MLVSLLLGSCRRRALGLLLLRHEQSYHVNDIASITGISVGTLHNELAKLAQAGLLSARETGRQMHYSANTQCPIFPELQALLRKVFGVIDVLREVVDKNSERILLSFVFGAAAEGEEECAGNEVDVLVVSNLPWIEVAKVFHPAQSMLQREVKPIVYSPDDFRRKISSGDSVLHGIIGGEKLFLNGSEDGLRKLRAYP